MAFSTPIEWQQCTPEQQQALLLRPAIAASENVTLTVRDVLELMLMARCGSVGAPSQSAFSRAAHIVGGVAIVPLAAGLPAPVAHAAHEALLDRSSQGKLVLDCTA